MNNTESLTFDPPPPILYDDWAEIEKPLVLTINCNASIESAKLEGLDEFVGSDYSLDVNSSISNSTLTLTINSFGLMFPFYCIYVDTTTLETRTVHNKFNILPGEKIYKYHKTQVARRILNLEIITKYLARTYVISYEESEETGEIVEIVKIVETEEIETTNFQVIPNTNYTTQIPLLLSEVAAGKS